jgi:chorismate synthase
MSRFTFLTAGESHGKALVVVIEGMVAGLAISEDYINKDLTRRQSGYGRGERMKIERDKVELISGVRHSTTIGTPISMLIQNRDWENWKKSMSVTQVDDEVEKITVPRPGHADLAGAVKFGLDDIRPVIERASARETTARVAVGAIARKFLEEFDIYLHSHTTGIGSIHAVRQKSFDWEKIESSPVRCADAGAEAKMIAAIEKAKESGDTLGGVFEVIAHGVPVGLGSYTQWSERLDSRIAQAIMSINAVKGVEIGDGFHVAGLPGSQAHDIISSGKKGSRYFWDRPTNWAGGIEGGISNGEDIIVVGAVKPISTLHKDMKSIDLTTGKEQDARYERSDVCIVPAAGVIGEAMLAIILTEAMLEKFGGDNLKETLANYRNYINTIK